MLERLDSNNKAFNVSILEEKANTLRSISHNNKNALKGQIEGLQEVSAIEWISRYTNKRILMA